jgi:hypothetical protein
MGKCSFLITKGKKKGSKCGIYTSKIHDKKYLCAAHYKLVNEEIPDSESESDEVPKKKEHKKEIKKSSDSKTHKKEPKKEFKKEKSEESDDIDLEKSEDKEVEKIKQEIPVTKKYKRYEPTDEDYQKKDLDQLLNEVKENEFEKPNDEVIIDKLDILIKKINKIESSIADLVLPPSIRPKREMRRDKIETIAPEMEVFN